MVRGLLVLFFFQWLGEWISLATQAPIPGPVIGMLLLLLALLIRQKVSSDLQQSSHMLVQHLSLLFLPAGVGIFFLSEQVLAQWPAIAAAMVVGTFISLLLSSWIVKSQVKSND
ncbi:CidA/LrgA family protein [uncultured Pseudoteredinibacter sp.]|uniref:CidA/LrgA family protein n=1 Tax=uncultured Pseudoteredinibacter sp. TaxID=1641701 RepID=UPI0026083FA5|nr:CidA/LrgA family protein [uncultured Pseudoteredinibacter sp.]